MSKWDELVLVMLYYMATHWIITLTLIVGGLMYLGYLFGRPQ